MTYKVTRKCVLTEDIRAPGEHYKVTDPDQSTFRKIWFYRSPTGREVATDNNNGCPLSPDGDLFRAVKAAVEEYDQAVRASPAHPTSVPVTPPGKETGR